MVIDLSVVEKVRKEGGEVTYEKMYYACAGHTLYCGPGFMQQH